MTSTTITYEQAIETLAIKYIELCQLKRKIKESGYDPIEGQDLANQESMKVIGMEYLVADLFGLDYEDVIISAFGVAAHAITNEAVA